MSPATAAIRPSRIATSRTALMLFFGSITCPPFRRGRKKFDRQGARAQQKTGMRIAHHLKRLNSIMDHHAPPHAAVCFNPPRSRLAAATRRHRSDCLIAFLSVCEPRRPPVINGVGVVTVLGGSIMPPEVIRAMEEASRFFIPLPELERKVGARIAELLQAPAAMVTCGAASAITVGTAACLSQGDPAKLRQLPNRDGIRFEVIQQKSHRSGYEHQMELCGAKIVTVQTRKELESAINERTGMMFFLNKAERGRRDSSRGFRQDRQRTRDTHDERRRLRRDAERKFVEVHEDGLRSGDFFRRQSASRTAGVADCCWGGRT